MIRQLVRGQRPPREVLGEMLPNPFDRTLETFNGAPGPNLRCELVDDRLPSAFGDTRVNPLSATISTRCSATDTKNENARSTRRRVEVLSKKLLARAPPRIGSQNRFRHQRHAHLGMPGKRQEREENDELDKKDPLHRHPREVK